MEDFGDGVSRRRNTALIVWGVCVALLIGPALLVWVIRGAGYAANCLPGPDPCRGMVLGGGMRQALQIAWALPTNTLLMISVAIVATIAAFFAKRPLIGAIGLIVFPVAALMLPMLAVLSAKYQGCMIDESGIGDCVLWGARMGMSFHTADMVGAMIYDFAPYTFALALMMGLLGWFFTQPRPARPHAMARMRKLGDPR